MILALKDKKCTNLQGGILVLDLNNSGVSGESRSNHPDLCSRIDGTV